MADRMKAVRGRKRTSGKGQPPLSAADLFDSLMQGQEKTADEPKPKQTKRTSLTARTLTEVKMAGSEPADSAAPESGRGSALPNVTSLSRQPQSPTDQAGGLRGASDDSEDEEAPVFITLSAVDSTASPEQSPEKISGHRKSRNDSLTVKEVEDEAKNETNDQENGKILDTERVVEGSEVMDAIPETPAEAAAGNGDASEKVDDEDSKSRRNSTETGGVGALGVSKDVEDSIRKEIENMLANNRLRNGGGRATGAGDDSEMADMNGHEAIDLEEDVILMEAERKKQCRFLIRRQEDQTLPNSSNYRCFQCSFNSSRMNNMIRHYKECSMRS